jgi:hypothetical protein
MAGAIRQIRASNIPFPHRFLLELEVRRDIDSGGEDGEFAREDLCELERIHSTRLRRGLAKLKAGQRLGAEMFGALTPLFTAFFFIIKEDTMLQFIREGGAIMFAILIIGAFLLGKEALNFFRLVVIKDHAGENLRLDTALVWLGCSALMCIGIGGTLLGFYVSAKYVEQSHASYEILLIGAKESLTCTILSSMFCALIAFMHFATRQMMTHWRAPLSK